jgi:DNA-binding Xre family transcriptional regulator
MKYELIKKVMAIKKVSTSSLCKELNMTDHGYRAMMRNKTMKVDTLEKICNLLKISPVELLDVEPLESAGIGIALLELDRIKEKIDKYVVEIQKWNVYIKIRDKLNLLEEEERLTSMSEFRKYENEMNAFIKELSSGNLKLEQKISGMIEEIDMDLHENNNIELNLLKNNDYSEKGNKAVKTIVDENLGLLKNKLATARNDYYISILMIVILGLFIIYVGYETYNRYIL